MTDSQSAETTMPPTAEQPHADRPDTETQPAETEESSVRTADVWRYIAWGGLAVCSLLAVFALLQLYSSVGDAIDIWVEPRHQPLMRAAFNLTVLLGSLIGVSLLVRELS